MPYKTRQDLVNLIYACGVADGICPACGKSAHLILSEDRFFHADGTDNEQCWRETLRGHTIPVEQVLFIDEIGMPWLKQEPIETNVMRAEQESGNDRITV
ncbi:MULTISPECIES: hypothetical protein [Mycolicibacterium]|uniref:hypothetical protein n=1 Tax=Mycolicibacterium TaxID=1866885 RepID=UPI00103B6BD9|nr:MULTISPECIES: hypothetical protein [Mycolicibacterium]